MFRLIGLLGGLSSAMDLGSGAPLDESLKRCVVAARPAHAAAYTLPLYVTGPLESDTARASLAFGAFAVAALVLRPFAGPRTPLLVPVPSSLR